MPQRSAGGFSSILIIIAIVLICFIIGGGTYIIRSLVAKPKNSPIPVVSKPPLASSSANTNSEVSTLPNTTAQPSKRPSPSPDSAFVITTNPKVFTAKDGSFTFQYPGNWAHNTQSTADLPIADGSKKYPTTHVSFYGLPVETSEKKTSFLQFSSKDLIGLSNEDFIKHVFGTTYSDIENLTIGDNQVMQAKITHSSIQYGYKTIFVLHKSDSYVVFEDDEFNDVESFKNLLATFKFLK